MTDQQQHGKRIAAWPLAVVLLLLMTVYILSYAPVVRMRGGWKSYATTDLAGRPATVTAPVYGADLPAYIPVDWLIDNTPLRDPLLKWAEFCGVGSTFREAMMWRPRGTRP